MKKYTITVTSREITTIEVIAKDDEDALKKAYEFDIDDCDWIGDGFEYDIDNAEIVEYTEEDAMNDVLDILKKYKYTITKLGENQYLIPCVQGRIVWLPLPEYNSAAELIRAVIEAYKHFDAGREALAHIKELDESLAASKLMSILTSYNVEKEKLFCAVEELENLFGDS